MITAQEAVQIMAKAHSGEIVRDSTISTMNDIISTSAKSGADYILFPATDVNHAEYSHLLSLGYTILNCRNDGVRMLRIGWQPGRNWYVADTSTVISKP